MARKDTLTIKKAVSEAAVGETKRCLSILRQHYKNAVDKTTQNTIAKAMETIVKEFKHLEFYPELVKKIPKI